MHKGRSLMADVLVSALSKTTLEVIWCDGLMLKEWCLHMYPC